jgi:PAS domain S-box-containing protein
VQTPRGRDGELAEARDRLTRLQALTASLSEAVTSEQVADAILEQAAAVLGTSASVVYRLGDDNSELVSLRTTGYPEQAAAPWRRLPVKARTPLSDAVRDRQPVLLANLAEREARYPEIAHISGVPAEGALAALPLVIRGKAIGGLGLRFPTGRTFTDQDRAFLLTIAGLCAQALERARLYDTERAARERAERAEDALRSSERRHRLLSDLTSDFTFGLRFVEGGPPLLEWVSESFAKFSGFTLEELNRRGGWPTLVHPDDLPITFGTVEQVREGQRDESEVRLVVRSGEVRRVRYLTHPVRDEAGEVRGFVGAAQDIHERTRSELASRESAERFSRFMQHLPGLAWIKDAQGRYMYANDAAVNAFGKTRAEVYGRTDEELFASATAAQFRENDRKALASGTGVRVVETLEHEDGVLHYSLVSKFPIPGPAGAAAVVGGMAFDITEEMRTRAVLEESEERFRATFEQAAVGIAHVGLDGRWLRVNRKLCDIVCYGPDEMLALTFQDITHPDDLEADLAYVRRLLAGEIETYSMEKRYIRKDRSLVWIDLTVALVRTPGGSPKYFISVVEDITEKKGVRDALREADRSKDNFLATLAHELRNPLAPLRNGLQVMKLASDNAEAVEKARGMMERQLAQLVRLIDDLLDVSRITRGKLELRKGRVELADVVQSAVEGSHPLIEASAHRLTVSLPPDPVHLDADPVRLSQVFTNLLTNAAKYTDRGGHIRLTAERHGAKSWYLSKTREWESPPSTCPGCSRCSPRWARPWSGRRAASASAFRSSRAWSRCTAARCRPTAKGCAGEASSSSGCR